MEFGTIETKRKVLGHLKMAAYAKLITVERMNNLDALSFGLRIILDAARLFGRISIIESQPIPKFKKGGTSIESGIAGGRQEEMILNSGQSLCVSSSLKLN